MNPVKYFDFANLQSYSYFLRTACVLLMPSGSVCYRCLTRLPVASQETSRSSSAEIGAIVHGTLDHPPRLVPGGAAPSPYYCPGGIWASSCWSYSSRTCSISGTGSRGSENWPSGSGSSYSSRGTHMRVSDSSAFCPVAPGCSKSAGCASYRNRWTTYC